jgi:SAM-dependent methyltransferase
MAIPAVRPRPDLAALVPPTARRVLDVGCGTGGTGVAIKARLPGCWVAGIELDPGQTGEARGRLDEVVGHAAGGLPFPDGSLEDLPPHKPADVQLRAKALKGSTDRAVLPALVELLRFNLDAPAKPHVAVPEQLAGARSGRFLPVPPPPGTATGLVAVDGLPSAGYSQNSLFSGGGNGAQGDGRPGEVGAG